MLDLNIDNKAAFNRDHYVRFDRLLIANPGSPLNLLNQWFRNVEILFCTILLRRAKLYGAVKMQNRKGSEPFYSNK